MSADDMIAAKTLAYTLCSPLDTLRQNKLLGLDLTTKKVFNSMGVACGGGFILSGTCHKTIELGETINIPSVLSVVLGVFVTNVIKTPIVFNYKRVQTGLSPILKMPKASMKSLFAMNVLEDIVEETVKYTLARYRVKTQKTDDNLFLDSLLLFSISYPFDVIKNGTIYNTKINGSYFDFFTKCVHKNVQNIVFFKTLMCLHAEKPTQS